MTNLYNEDNFDKKERMKQDQLIHQTRNLDILPPADVAKVKATLRRSMTMAEIVEQAPHPREFYDLYCEDDLDDILESVRKHG